MLVSWKYGACLSYGVDTINRLDEIERNEVIGERASRSLAVCARTYGGIGRLLVDQTIVERWLRPKGSRNTRFSLYVSGGRYLKGKIVIDGGNSGWSYARGSGVTITNGIDTRRDRIWATQRGDGGVRQKQTKSV